jgi:O-antigen ligase
MKRGDGKVTAPSFAARIREDGGKPAPPEAGAAMLRLTRTDSPEGALSGAHEAGVRGRERFDSARVGLLLVGLMWLLPFLDFHAPLPIPSFYGELTAAVLGLAAMTVLLRQEAWQPFELPRIGLLPLGLAGLVLMQFPFGKIVYPQQALLGMLYLLWALLLMVLGYRLRRVLGWERFAMPLAWFLLVGGVLSMLIVLLQQLGWHGVLLLPKGLAQSFGGNLGQANHFADYLALALASLLYLRAKGRVSLPAVIGLSATFLSLLALSGSRSSWLYLTAFAVLAWGMWRRGDRRHLLPGCLLLLPAFVLVQQIVPWLMEVSGGSAAPMPTERLFRDVSGMAVRLQIWQKAWQMFMGAPWLGVGFGQFGWNSFALVDHTPWGFVEPTEHAHNLLLHLLAEMGLLAGVLCVGLPLGWLVRATRNVCSLERWWLMALLAVVGIHSLLEYPLWYAYFLGVVAVLLGAGEQRALPLELGRVGRPAFAAVLLLGGLGLANLTQSYATLETWMQRGLRGQVTDREMPAMTRDLIQVHHASLLSPYVALVFAASIEPSRQRLEDKLQLSESAMRFSPIRHVVYRHAVLLALKGDRDAARVQLRRAMRAYPHDVPRFERELRQVVPKDSGAYEFLLNEIAVQAE